MKPSGQAVEEWAKSVASKDKRPLTEKEATEFIKRFMSQKDLADAYGNNFYEAREEYPEVAGSTHKPYIFEIAGVKVNVWCVKEFTHSMLVEPEESASLHLCLHYVERWHTRGKRTLETHYRSHLH